MVPHSQPGATILAAVVTYNPDGDLAGNLRAVRAQVDVVVVDNNSDDVATVEAVARGAGCRWLPNSANLGIAAALNQVVRIAEREGVEWLATFDQDSRIPEGAFEALLAMVAAHPERDRIAIASMSHIDSHSNRHYGQPPWGIIEETHAWRSVRSTITSGCLVRMSALKRTGPFDEAFFIDAVDHEFCLRCREAGFLIIEDKTVSMRHSIGAVTQHRLFGRTLACTNHSAARQYYVVRNSLETMLRALNFDRRWALRMLIHLGSGVVRVMLYETQRREKLAAMMEGAWDFAMRRFGPRPIHR